MKKEDAIRIITNCAKLYHENLEGKNLLFLYGSPQLPQHFEAVFLPKHFLHFTGVALVPQRIVSSIDFYDRCLNRNLSPSDFGMPDSGTVEMKLSVLPRMMKISTAAKMIGEYDLSKSLLYTEKLAGNVSACMGFVQDDGYYHPNTILKEDIRDVTKRPQKKVLAVFGKTLQAPTYTEVCYIAKGIDLSIVKDLPKVITYQQDDIAATVEQVTPPQYNPADAPTSEKPSIRAQLQAYQQEQRDKAPAVVPTKNWKDLER